MNIFMRIMSFAAGAAVLSAMAVTASAVTHTAYVSCNKQDEQHYKTGGVELYNFYDYGTTWYFDDACILSRVSSNGTDKAMAYIDYANYGSNDFLTECKTTTKKEVEVKYNPIGVDMLQPLSYAHSSGDGENFYLRVTY